MALFKQRRQALGFLAAAGMFWSLSASAQLIDDFSTDQFLRNIAPGNSVTDTVAGIDIIGGSRTIEARNLTGPTTFSMLDVIVVSGELFVNNDTDVDGEVDIIWDSFGAGLGGVDLTLDASGIAMEVLSIDQDVTVEFLIEDLLGGDVSSSGAQTFAGPGLFFVDFLDFVGTADFTDVNKITMNLRGPLAWDGRIDFVEATERVPEPATILIMGIGLLGMGASRRRVKK